MSPKSCRGQDYPIKVGRYVLDLAGGAAAGNRHSPHRACRTTLLKSSVQLPRPPPAQVGASAQRSSADQHIRSSRGRSYIPELAPWYLPKPRRPSSARGTASEDQPPPKTLWAGSSVLGEIGNGIRRSLSAPTATTQPEAGTMVPRCSTIQRDGSAVSNIA